MGKGKPTENLRVLIILTLHINLIIYVVNNMNITYLPGLQEFETLKYYLFK